MSYLTSVVWLFSVLSMTVLGQTPCNVSLQNSIQLNTSGVFAISSVGSGRVEICSCIPSTTNCYWQTVSTGSNNNPFSWKNSIVVCRELGYFDVQSPILQNTLIEDNYADASVDIYSTTFICDGTESSLIECDKGVQTSSQTHEADAYLTCQTASVNGKVRLTGSTSSVQGVVEYYDSNQLGWSTVCPDFWDNVEADTFCRSLGFIRGRVKLFRRDLFNALSNIQVIPTIGTINCDLNDNSIVDCPVTYNSACADFTSLAGVVCDEDNGRAEGSVRQYDIGSSQYNRVEVYYGGRWGTVCNTAWELSSGQVACRELGYTPSLTQVPSSSFFGFSPISTSSRPIWIVGYNCDGTESRLRNCLRPSFPVGYLSQACSHYVDAGLYCDSEPEPPHRLSSGEIAAIAISVITAVGTFIAIIILYDKHKKGELRVWYNPRRQRFLRWYRPRRQRLRNCCQRRRRTTRPQQQQQQLQQQQPLQQQQQPPQQQQQMQPPVVQVTATAPPVQSQLEYPTVLPHAPPSYDDALRSQDVRPPPQYFEKTNLPYPETKEHDNPAYPPPAHGSDNIGFYP